MKKIDKMETQNEVTDFVFKMLKDDNRKEDTVAFMSDINGCHSLEQLKELAEWYVSKPKF